MKFQRRKIERSYNAIYIVIKPVVVETNDDIEPKNLCVLYGFTALGARKIIYTTNLNSCLRKVTSGKGVFINTETLLKVLYLRIKYLEKSWCIGSRNWNMVKNQLIELFGERT